MHMGKHLIAQVVSQTNVKQWTKTQQEHSQTITKNPITNERQQNKKG